MSSYRLWVDWRRAVHNCRDGSQSRNFDALAEMDILKHYVDLGSRSLDHPELQSVGNHPEWHRTCKEKYNSFVNFKSWNRRPSGLCRYNIYLPRGQQHNSCCKTCSMKSPVICIQQPNDGASNKNHPCYACLAQKECPSQN